MNSLNQNLKEKTLPPRLFETTPDLANFLKTAYHIEKCIMYYLIHILGVTVGYCLRFINILP